MEYEVSLGSDDLDGKTPRQVTLLPFLVKKSLEYLPAIMSLRGTLPSSSMINAIWSIWLQEEEEGGGHKQDRQQICQTKSQSGTRSGSVGVGQRSD